MMRDGLKGDFIFYLNFLSHYFYCLNTRSIFIDKLLNTKNLNKNILHHTNQSLLSLIFSIVLCLHHFSRALALISSSIMILIFL